MVGPVPHTYRNGWATRRVRTPGSYTRNTLDTVVRWLDSRQKNLGKDSQWFVNAFNEAARTSEYDPDYCLQLAFRVRGGKSLLSVQTSAIIACAVAVRDAEEMGDERVAWTYAMDTMQMAAVVMSGWGEFYDGKSRRARLSALARLAHDPKQAAKAEVFKLWHDWQSGKARFVSGAAFARAACEQFPAIVNPKTVERWTTQWRKEAAAKRKKQASS